MVEIFTLILDYCKQRKIKLPVFLFLLLTSLTIGIIYKASIPKDEPLPLPTPEVLQMEPLNTNQGGIKEEPKKVTLTQKPKAPKREQALRELRPVEEKKEEPAVYQEGNVKRAQLLAEDYLRTEGIDSDTVKRIFERMYAQTESYYDLGDVIRSVVGYDVDDDKIYHIRDLILKSAKETLNR